MSIFFFSCAEKSQTIEDSFKDTSADIEVDMSNFRDSVVGK